ncbi:MAG: MptD family putative ECF transporter S component [Saccharofermentans sp.]|nr:MptD family putative ECF transporter S component [Saccharofermentans sp.]
MKNKLKIKDVVTVALLTALYLIFYLGTGAIATFTGSFGHAISPGICAFFTGSIFFFMSRKVGRFGQFTIMQAVCLLLFTVMGAGYLPWIITSMAGALLGDLIASTSKKPATWKVAVASGLFHVGQAFGSIIPSIFFVDSYREEWIARGVDAATMDERIRSTTGYMSIVSTLAVFVLSFVGVYIGYLILRKHFEKKESEAHNS